MTNNESSQILYVVVSSAHDPNEPHTMDWIVANEVAAYTRREDAEAAAAQDANWSVEIWPAEKVKMAIDIFYWDIRKSLVALRKQQEKHPATRGDLVAQARKEGMTWLDIANLLGMTQHGLIKAQAKYEQESELYVKKNRSK